MQICPLFLINSTAEKSCGGEQGSGLGLYIVKYVAEKMGGKIVLHNHKDGLEAILQLPAKVSQTIHE